MGASVDSNGLLMSINSKMFVSIVSLVVTCMCLKRNCYAFEFQGRKLVEKHQHEDVFDVTSLFSTSCQASVQGTNRPGSMKITHSHGYCSKPSKNEPTLAEILTRDQSRVASIQNRNAFKAELDRTRISKTSIPAKSGLSLGTGNYVVSVGLGTPAKYVTLVFDTGSSLTWTQCKPCVKYCYVQSDPIFDPSASATYGNISCTSTQCSELSASTGNTPSCSSTTCVYGIQYGDQSFSVGFFGRERLTLTQHDVFENFLFGCGENNRGLFGNSAGLLGLGRDSLSVVSQTAQKYGKYFSYCLPTKSGSNGHLSFGKYGAPRNLAFTPFASGASQGSSFYFVTIVGMSVGGKQLPISSSVFQSGGTIVDSGTVITRLPPTAYTALRDSFKQQMSKYPLAPGLSILDTCYDFSNYTTVTIPKIGFVFAGNANVLLGANGILVAASQAQICLAFAPNGDDTDTGIYGNTQQQTYEVAYDVAGGRLGFGPNACS